MLSYLGFPCKPILVTQASFPCSVHIITDCGLEKYSETRGSNHDKVAFKISGISCIHKGIPPLNEISALGASPLKRAFFVSNNILFTYTDIDLITQEKNTELGCL